ncbi:hypothetical protein IL306_004873 [Fusarium sp. DS 682]|nr:hypothetical protein IL306_004873 [Fusarium sp. DS 682]
MALTWGWLSDGPLQGARWPFIYAGAILIHGAGPLILSWINEICSADTEKRALIVAIANDLAYVVQAIVLLWRDRRKPMRLRNIESPPPLIYSDEEEGEDSNKPGETHYSHTD